jgi:hypothetical protein
VGKFPSAAIASRKPNLSVIMAQMKQLSAKGADASRLRQRKYELVREYGIPENLIGGSLAPTRRRCGKPTCHCRQGPGHLQWSVTFCQYGNKRVERVPYAWVEELETAVLESQQYLAAVREVMAINLELLAQTRQQQKKVRGGQKKRPVSQKSTQPMVTNDQLLPATIDH